MIALTIIREFLLLCLCVLGWYAAVWLLAGGPQ